jgi:hypothetical protein
MLNPAHEGPVTLRMKETSLKTGEVVQAEGFRRDSYTDALESINTLYDIIQKYGNVKVTNPDFNSFEYEVFGSRFIFTITEV